MKDLISYDQETGIFRWLVNRGGAARAGAIAGTPHRKGYTELNVGGKRYLAHRLAWELTHGEIPEGMQVDHINRIKTDNRIANLRLCTHGENLVNRSGYSKQGLPKNIERTHNGKYYCRVRINNVRITGKVRDTIEQALADRAELSAKHHGQFAC